MLDPSKEEPEKTGSIDSPSAKHHVLDSDAGLLPLKGAIGPEQFPPDIPLPPTPMLPAEIECQLCFMTVKIDKPSDWTKHVHQDVQPFTCTWERCKEPKMFKRTADWVLHENELHRHLEWWACDVDDCAHECYRRDTFLQHLVREHKFYEPKVKTKAAIRRAGNIDPTWAKVEQCYHQTTKVPQDEPCRFCGTAFSSWKMLTVHVARHMKYISLQVFRLLVRKDEVPIDAPDFKFFLDPLIPDPPKPSLEPFHEPPPPPHLYHPTFSRDASPSSPPR